MGPTLGMMSMNSCDRLLELVVRYGQVFGIAAGILALLALFKGALLPKATTGELTCRETSLGVVW